MKKLSTRSTSTLFSIFAGSSFFLMGWFSYKLIERTEILVFSSKSNPSDTRSLELGKTSKTSEEISGEPKAIMNDPAITQAWGLTKTDAAKAWSLSQGSRKIWVAVIDTGADIKHEDLTKNIWINPGESGIDSKGRNKATNGIDDDGNNFIDDVHGWNFVSNNSNLQDNHGHGTHIAGIIGAEAGNKKGIAGIAPEVSLMILKYFDPKAPSTDNLKNTVNAIRYAIKMKANIINYSGGGLEFSQEEYDAIDEARRQGILFVAAAGNERSNSDHFHYYPADYKLKNIISVTAIDPSIKVLPSSNYGTETVDIAAPGQNILSTLPNNQYGYMTGTSQGTAFVTGAAVLVKAHRENADPESIKKYILATGDSEENLIAKTKNSRRLNLFKALSMLDSGTGVSGIVAANTINMKQFTNNVNTGGNNGGFAEFDSTRNISTFGKILIHSLEKGNRLRKN